MEGLREGSDKDIQLMGGVIKFKPPKIFIF
ncbi:hypothetical protein SAMN05192573_11573 [Mucilaginibacter gossypii]|uniref:Uncharacterized protein n=1 Tax=Mucilaginibacter gossypii TaxID=551996 RepID=A0A1G8H8L1_9SPHI|nr:hypothetical protein SAMN05192573_11573 [Mucilaginibacter gossypii]